MPTTAIASNTNILPLFEQWVLIVALKANALSYPVLEVVHLVGIGIVFGTLWVVDLRLLGLMRALDARILAKNILPWTMLGFLLAAAAGLTMFMMRVSDLINNPMFIAKICLLFSAGTNAAILHARGALDATNAITRLQAALSILIWIAVIFCGRWIAYV